MKRRSLIAVALLASQSLADPLPQNGPLPKSRPEQQPAQGEHKSDEKSSKPEPQIKPEEKGPLKGTVLTPPAELRVEKESDADHAACVAALTGLKVVFSEKPRIDEGQGCGIDRPLSVSALPGGIALKPEAVIDCKAALALSRWVQGSVVPAAAVAFAGSRVVSVENASAYVCRLRNNATTGKISEHARGNAIDIAAFTLSNGERVEIRPRREDSTFSGAFQRSVTATACLYFTTVLDPESDAAHERHLHLDTLERKGGYRYCR